MDTLEYRTEIANGSVRQPPPILWRGKTARDVYHQRYSDGDYSFTASEAPPLKATRTDMEFCRSYTVNPVGGETQAKHRDYALLIEIPEKK